MDSLSQKMQQPVSQMITIKGQRLRVTIRPGNGTQTPLLLMNGLGARLEVFQSFIDELDPSLEVISFDVPGMGDSPAPVIPYHLTSLACLVASMLDKLGYKQVDVLGLSWGGWLAQQFAFQYSMRCRRLILACTGLCLSTRQLYVFACLIERWWVRDSWWMSGIFLPVLMS